MRRFVSLICLTLSMMLLCSAAFAESTEAVEPAARYEAPKQIVVTFTGDCTLGCTPDQRLVKAGFETYIQQNGLEYPFALVKDVFLNDDLTVVNLEGAFYDSDNNMADKTYHFRSPVAYADMLPLAGIDAVSIGNNHILDYGAVGQQSTLEALEARGIHWFGTNDYADNAYIYEKDGVKIGFVSIYYSDWAVSGRGTAMRQKVADLKADGCNLVVACLHVGVEYAPRHDANQDRIANRFIDYGADIVIGHHPHVIQGIREENGHATLWSLGNFCFGGNPKFNTPEALYTYIAQFTFSFDENGKYLGHQLNILPARVSGSSEYNDYQPRLVEGAEAAKVLKLIQNDTTWKLPLKPYVPGVGALQEFVPAPAK